MRKSEKVSDSPGVTGCCQLFDDGSGATTEVQKVPSWDRNNKNTLENAMHGDRGILLASGSIN
jgi:hypothetical protein